MSPAANVRSELIDSHEERIQKTEEGAKDFAASLAVNSEKIDSLSSRVEENFQVICKKIDEAVTGKLIKMADTLDTLEDDFKARQKRSENYKKALYALGGAAFAAMGKELFAFLIVFFK